jgi:hypothetical protein
MTTTYIVRRRPKAAAGANRPLVEVSRVTPTRPARPILHLKPAS